MLFNQYYNIHYYCHDIKIYTISYIQFSRKKVLHSYGSTLILKVNSSTVLNFTPLVVVDGCLLTVKFTFYEAVHVIL